MSHLQKFEVKRKRTVERQGSPVAQKRVNSKSREPRFQRKFTACDLKI
jgi:hypothetical protein